jgi:two-component system, NtrC family, C4-dicarboxylate transport response regulator DctD
MSAPVVYIDDEPALCRVFEMILGERGLAIVTFTDAGAAVEYLRTHEAAVVVCDLRMPSMSGLDVLARLERPVPFYLVSGSLELADFAERPGVTGVLEKPFPAEVLLEIVARHVAGR